MLRLVPEVRGASRALEAPAAVSMAVAQGSTAAAGSLAANTAVVAGSAEAARANRSRPSEDVETQVR